MKSRLDPIFCAIWLFAAASAAWPANAPVKPVGHAAAAKPATPIRPAPAPAPVYQLDIAAYKAPDGFKGTAETASVAGGATTLKVVGNGEPWNSYFVSPLGLLKGGHDYTATLTYEIVDVPVGSYCYMYARSNALGYGFDKWVRFSGKPGDKGSITLPMSLAKADDYTITLGMHKKAAIIVDGLVVRQGLGWTSVAPSWSLGPLPNGYNPNVAKTLTGLPTGSAAFTIDPPKPGNQIVLDATTYGLVADTGQGRVTADQAARNSGAMAAAIRASKAANASKLNIPAGVYRFTGNTAIHFEDLTDLTVEGNGAQFIFDKYHSWHEPAIEIDRCTRCVFQNFTLDWDWDKMPLATVGHVTDLGVAAFDMEFPHLDAVATERMKSLPWEDLYEVNPVTMSAIGPEFDMSGWAGSKFETVGPNVLRVHPAKPFPIAAGVSYRIRHAQYDLDGFWLGDDTNLSMRNVTMYSIPGEGWIVSGDTNHLELSNCKIVMNPNEHRSISTAADGFHVNQSKGYIKLTNCDIGFCGDDCVNIHDNCSQGISLVDANSIIALNVDKWKTPFHVGDTVELRKPDLSPIPFTSTLTAVNFAGRSVKLTFADALPAGLAPDTILFNRRYGTSNVVIDGCHFHDNRGRGILLAADNVTVSNNRIERTSSEGVYVQTEIADLWSEGYGANNLFFAGNTFNAVNPAGNFDGSAIAVTPTIPAGTVSYPIFQDLRFEGNHFDNCDGSPISIASSKNVTIINNGIRYDANLGSVNPMRGQISVVRSSGVRVFDNLFSAGLPNAGLSYDPASTSAIAASANFTLSPTDAARF